jgi:hypothetical protein
VSKILKIALPMMVALMSLVAVAQASAVTVTVTPSGAKTLTSTTDVRFVITSGSTRTTVDCTVMTIVGTVNSASGSLAVAISTNIQFGFTGCTLPGGLRVTIGCSPTAVLSVTGLTSGGVTPISITNISCTISLTSAPSCRTTIEGPGTAKGSVGGSYSNSTNQLTINTAGQSLASKNSTCTSTFPNGTVNLASSAGGNIIFAVTPATTITAV